MSDRKDPDSRKVLHLQVKRPGDALERLRRLTGLNWHSYPESLMSGTWIRHAEQ
ncbi:hypothetical protein [Allohahella marinimesophila]|uniref:Uncharacterized protein n=1 Tax=Allohahella marinimesophila TaxID=1054972 RepID=A0ABP7NYD7_9GAMM